MAPSKSITSFALIAGSAIAVAGCGGASTSNSASSPAAGSGSVATHVQAAPAPMALTMLVKSDTEKAKLGPDKQWHDAFLPGDVTVKAGQSVTITVWNYDDKHSFNAPSLGINQMLAGGTAKAPHKTTFTFKAPSKPGSYAWFCAMPCDPWAMSHDGYMRGYVKVTA